MREYLSSKLAVDGAHLFMCLALCHSAIVSTKRNTRLQDEFISESEDEIALLAAAKQFGYRFSKRTDQALFIKIFDEETKFELKGQLPFDSDRKMMSVVVRNTDTGETILFSKGADQSILDRCSITQELKKKVYEKADKFGTQSLRTMVVAMRKFDNELVKAFTAY